MFINQRLSHGDDARNHIQLNSMFVDAKVRKGRIKTKEGRPKLQGGSHGFTY